MVNKLTMRTTIKKITQKEIANLAHIGPDFLSHIIRGRRRCPRDVASRLEEATGISRLVWVWGTPQEIRKALDEYMYQPQGKGNNGH